MNILEKQATFMGRRAEADEAWREWIDFQETLTYQLCHMYEVLEEGQK